MDLLIVSGLSGAGKSVAMNALEDIGFFCIDNVPAELLPSITAFSKAGDNQLKRVALSMDVRGCHTSEQIEQALHQLDEQGIEYEILFIDAPDDVLMRRYSETRRRHPISIAEGISTREALAKERQILQPFRERADYTINTEFLSTAQNKERICNLFAPDGGAKAAMRLTVMSFGFKFGIPEDANLVLDVRCLPNPFYDPKLKPMSGLDEPVASYVLGFEQARALQHAEPDRERAFRALNGEVVGPVMPGAAEITVSALRRGSGLSSWEARLTQGGDVLARASAIFGRERTRDHVREPARDLLPRHAHLGRVVLRAFGLSRWTLNRWITDGKVSASDEFVCVEWLRVNRR